MCVAFKGLFWHKSCKTFEFWPVPGPIAGCRTGNRIEGAKAALAWAEH